MQKFIFFCVLSVIFSINQTTAQVTVTGTVTDETKAPLPFATVYQKNSTNGTTSNANGRYQITVPTEAELVFQYIGYQSTVRRIETAAQAQTLDILMLPNESQLNEVVIDANAEDPAYPIMREAIARRKEHRAEIGDYKCDAYVKGFQKLLDAPDKVMGQEVGNMGGILDTSKQGIVYLSESVSQIYNQQKPKRSKEVMISSAVSGEPDGFSFNRANIVDLNFYNEKIEVERELLSPLASNTFAYYRFKLRSRTTENGREVAKIEVIPKRGNDPVFGGFLYIETQNYHINNLQLHLTGDNIHQPILDTIWVVQNYVPLTETPERWALLSQKLEFKFGVFGFKMKGFFSAVFSNYELNPDFSNIQFGKESFKVEEGANERDSTYWDSIRPVPLTTEEVSDYVKKDSLRVLWESKPFRDSMDRVSNKFSFFDLIFGYQYSNSYKHRYLGFSAPITTFLFNTVQGYNLRLNMFYNIFPDDKGTKSLYFRPSLSYGFSEKKLRGDLLIGRRFNKKNKDRLEFQGGIGLRQFDGQNPILPIINTTYSLNFRQNYMKLYEKRFGRIAYSGRYKNGVEASTSLEYAQRRPLSNTTNHAWTQQEDRRYTSNNPRLTSLIQIPEFEQHQALFFNLNLRYRFGQEYMSYPKERFYYDEGKPECYLNFRKGYSFDNSGSTVDFDFIAAGFEQDALSVGIGGYIEWNVQAGTFLNRKNVPFMDYQHMQGNQTVFGTPSTYTRRFLALPYYQFSTTGAFAEAHLQYHLQGFLLDKIPAIRKLNFNEVFGFSALYRDGNRLADGAPRPDLPYWEANFGIENLGFGAFRLFRLDVVSSFYGGKYAQTGIVLGVDL